MLYWIIRIIFWPIKFFPRRFELFMGKIVGKILYIFRFKRDLVRQNLSIVYSDQKKLDKIEKDNYTHYGNLVFELLHFPFDAARFAEKNVDVHNYEYLKKAMEKGKGVFFLSAHIGYWEIMGIMAMRYKLPLNVITKYLRIKLFDDIWVKSRESYGVKLIAETFSAKNVLKALRNKEIVGVVLDQFMGPPVGKKVLFFGKPAWTITSLAWFVQKTGAAVVPVVNYRKEDGRFDLILNPEVSFEFVGDEEKNIMHNTQRYTYIIEKLIKEHPEQWIWLHRRWKRTKEDELE